MHLQMPTIPLIAIAKIQVKMQVIARILQVININNREKDGLGGLSFLFIRSCKGTYDTL